MPRRLKPIGLAAEAFAQNASRQLAAMQRQLSAFSDRVAGLQNAIKAPVPAGGTRTIKGSRTTVSPFVSAVESSFGSLFAGGLLDEAGIGGGAAGRASFYMSQAQSGANWLSLATLGQRIS
jgi:hypothetical protein